MKKLLSIGLIILLAALAAGCQTPVGQSASPSAVPSATSVADPMTDTIFDIEGAYVPLRFTVPPHESASFLLEVEGQFVTLNSAGVLQFLDGQTGVSHYTETLQGEVHLMENCAYKDYSFRILYTDGHAEYRSPSRPQQSETVHLPEPLLQRYLAARDNAGQNYSLYDITYDIDPASDVSVVNENGTLLYWAGGEAHEIPKSDVPTNELEGYVQGAAIQYPSLRVMDGGAHIFASLYLPDGPNGQGQGNTAGLLVLNTQTGERYWDFYLFNWFNPGYAYVDDKNIMGMSYPDPEDFSSRPIKFNVETKAVETGFYYSEPYTPNDSNYCYEYYCHNSQHPANGGYSMDVLLNDEQTPLLTVSAPVNTMYMWHMSEHYVFVLLVDDATYYYLAVKYR